MDAHEYALARGWDFWQIAATATLGVAPEDRAALADTDLSPEALRDWCRRQLRDSQGDASA
jgi:hypothetical protein